MVVFLADKGHAEEWFLVLLLLMGFNKVTAKLYIMFRFISYFFMLFFFFFLLPFLSFYSFMGEGLRASVVYEIYIAARKVSVVFLEQFSS